VDEEIELLKLAEECGELVQVSTKILMGLRHTTYSEDRSDKLAVNLIEEMGDVLCHLKRTANALDIGWDELQISSDVKNKKVNKNYYGGEDVY